MIRTVIENLLLFLLPTVVYLAWTLLARGRGPAASDAGPDKPITGVLDDAPLIWLFASGALLVIVTLAAFGTSSGGKPGQHYQPPSMKDGQIEPGHIE
jgi:hypothetical protein